MKRYEFRLANVLEHRERIESKAQQHLASVERRLLAEEESLDRLRGEFDRLTEMLRRSHTTLDHDDLRMRYLRADYLSRSIRTSEVTIMNMRMEQEAARNELLKAAKERRILETLKERKLADYAEQSIRHEHAQLDDANSRRTPILLEQMKDVT